MSQFDSYIGCVGKLYASDLWTCFMSQSNTSRGVMYSPTIWFISCMPSMMASPMGRPSSAGMRRKTESKIPEMLDSGRSDSDFNDEIEKIQSTGPHMLARMEIFGNVSHINYIIGYNETDLGFVTICLAGDHLLTLLNVSFSLIFL